MGQLDSDKFSEADVKRLADGSIVEGLAPGGKVLIVRTEPQFARDILPYFSQSILVFAVMLMLIITNNFYMPFFIICIFSPCQNYFGNPDRKNLSPKSEKAFQNDKRFDLPLQFFVVWETVVYIWALIVMSDKVNPGGFWFSIRKPETFSDFFIFAFTIGFQSAVAGVNGHELLHHKETHNKVFGIFPLTKMMYTHFLDEHLKGHHKMVSTLEDPATSRLNESLFAFIPRSIYGSLVNVWGYESKLITQKYGEDANLFIRIFCNKMFWYQIFHGSILYTIYHFLGWNSLKFQLLYTVLGIYWLETVNYIEHYGMLRKKDENGIYESVGKMHSWNSMSGAVLVRLQRHSDHHAHSFRPFQILRRQDDAPYMPFEYLHNYFLATIPPLWFYVMNPKVEAITDIKYGRVNKQKTAWNNIMPQTEDDKKRLRVGYAALVLNQVFLTYMTFF